jgi:hypothetical protein
MESVIAMLAGLHPVVPQVLAALGGLVVLGQAYVAITPSQDDDAWFAKLEAIPVLGSVLVALKSFAPIQRKQ